MVVSNNSTYLSQSLSTTKETLHNRYVDGSNGALNPSQRSDELPPRLSQTAKTVSQLRKHENKQCHLHNHPSQHVGKREPDQSNRERQPPISARQSHNKPPPSKSPSLSTQAESQTNLTRISDPAPASDGETGCSGSPADDETSAAGVIKHDGAVQPHGKMKGRVGRRGSTHLGMNTDQRRSGDEFLTRSAASQTSQPDPPPPPPPCPGPPPDKPLPPIPKT